MDGWPGPELFAVYDPTRVAAPQEEDATVWATVPEEELRARSERSRRNRDELAARGVYIFGYSPKGEVHYFSVDQERAETLLRQRFGAKANFNCLGASRHALRSHPFGSWRADERALQLFYLLGQGREQAGGCIAAERDDCVIVSLCVLAWLGNGTLGGSTASHATVMLAAELGDRSVIDSFDNRARPDWRTAADIPVPRPQDL